MFVHHEHLIEDFKTQKICPGIFNIEYKLEYISKTSNMYGIMNRTPVIIGKINPDRANRTPTRSGGVLPRSEGDSFR